jgi:nicotinate-nucleotide adenylyltransferase
MIAMATQGESLLEVSDFELKKPAPSFTIETVRHFRDLFGTETVLYWLAGADALRELPHWHKAGEIMDECNVAIMHRAGTKMPDFTAFEAVWGRRLVEKLTRNVVPTPLVDVSSSRVRRAVAAGRDITEMVHPAVAEYIRRRGLYR